MPQLQGTEREIVVIYIVKFCIFALIADLLDDDVENMCLA